MNIVNTLAVKSNRQINMVKPASGKKKHRVNLCRGAFKFKTIFNFGSKAGS